MSVSYTHLYSLLPISQLIYRENYTIDHAGRQFCQAQSEQ